MSKITVLHIVGGMNRGGAETFLMNVLRNIDISKFQFIFLCYGEEKFDYEDEIIELGGKIVRTPDVKVVGPIRHIKNIEEIIQKEQVDIVHAHTYFNSMFSLIAAKNAGVKDRISHSHNTRSEKSPSFLKSLYFKISKYIINRYSTLYIACGESAGRALFYENNDFTVINNGVSLESFYYNSDKRVQLRENSTIPNDHTVILHVGRFHEQKNHTLVIDVYNEYLKLNPSSTLLLVGDGPLRSSIEQKVNALGIEDHVRFLGVRADVNELYNAADLFLFPSLFEGLPVVLVEAQVNGIACLVSDTIDLSVKITDCIHFYSLTQTASQWAKKIASMNLVRINTRDILEGSPYNMARNIKVIEKLYEGTGTN